MIIDAFLNYYHSSWKTKMRHVVPLSLYIYNFFSSSSHSIDDFRPLLRINDGQSAFSLLLWDEIFFLLLLLFFFHFDINYVMKFYIFNGWKSRRESDFFFILRHQMYPRYRTIKEWNYYCCKKKNKTNTDVWVYYTNRVIQFMNFPIHDEQLTSWNIYQCICEIFFPQLTQLHVKEWFFASPKPSSRACIKRRRMWCFWNILCTVQEREGSTNFFVVNNFFFVFFFFSYSPKKSKNIIKIVQCNCVRNRNERRKKFSDKRKTKCFCRH